MRRARGAAQRLGRKAAVLCALALALPAVAEERRIESVGAAPVGAGASRPAREVALEQAVRGAVLRVARELTGGAPAEEAEAGGGELAWLTQRLGDPLAYASQYSILEDRGERPAVFTSDPGVEREYVVLAAVTVDVGAVAERLASLGVISSAGIRTEVTLVVEGLDGYRPLALLRRTLERDRGVRSAVPVEFTPGRAVLALAADRGAREIVADLERSAPEGLEIVRLEVGAREATLLVRWEPEPEGEVLPGD